MGFGPEQVNIPENFIVPMSFTQYGGHASIHIRFDSTATESLYTYTKNTTTNAVSTTLPGDNIAFLQGMYECFHFSQR